MASRVDINNGVISGSWAGKDCIPFGLISCPGWYKPITRLSNKLTSLNRQLPPPGCRQKIINIRPSSEGFVFDISVRFSGSPSPQYSADLSAAISAARRSCARLCRVCGAPARHVLGESLCPSHASGSRLIESHFDKRKIRRAGVLLARSFGAKITHRVEFHGPGSNRLKAYSIDGILMARLVEARPGSRLQILDASSGVIRQLNADEFMIELPIKLWTDEGL